MMKLIGRLFLILTMCASPAFAEKAIYDNNFENAKLDKVPDEFLVLDGDFSVKQSDGNKYLELPGAPLDTFGVLFGPTTNAGIRVSARIFGTAKGRREPSFGVGLNGPSGYKLKVSPAKNALEIYKSDDSVATVPFAWKSGTWTMFKLQVRAVSDQLWKVEGKAWPQTEPEPADWIISVEEKTPPHPGRASLWGAPYSGTPIRFDDLLLTTE
jgi:hypothetical protein